MSEDVSPELKSFLESDCKAGEYVAMTLMVNKQHMRAFTDHLNAFQAKLAAIKNGTGEGIVLGMDKKQKLEVLPSAEKIDEHTTLLGTELRISRFRRNDFTGKTSISLKAMDLIKKSKISKIIAVRSNGELIKEFTDMLAVIDNSELKIRKGYEFYLFRHF